MMPSTNLRKSTITKTMSDIDRAMKSVSAAVCGLLLPFQALCSGPSVSNGDNAKSLVEVAIMVNVAGGGVIDVAKVGGVPVPYRGQDLALGRRYTLIAKPTKGWRFGGWSGSFSNNSSRITFVAQSNLTFSGLFTVIPTISRKLAIP